MSSSNKVSLDRLPPELLMEINRHLGYNETASLSRSSKYLCNIFDGLLYEDVENDSDSEKEYMVLLWAAYWGRLDTIKKLRGVHLGRYWIGLFVDQIEIATRYFGIYDYWSSQAPATQEIGLRPDQFTFLRDICDAVTCTALHVAASQNQGQVIEFLLDRGVEINALGQDVNCGRREQEFSLNSLLPNRLHHYSGIGDWTPLHFAICGGHLTAVKLLLSRGASFLVGRPEPQHPTALHSAAAAGDMEVLKAVHDHFSHESIDTVDERDKTALMWAWRYDNRPAFTYLVRLGADKAAQDDKGLSILQRSCRDLEIDRIEWLLKKRFHIDLPIDDLTLALNYLIDNLCDPWDSYYEYPSPEVMLRIKAIIRALMRQGAKPVIVQTPDDYLDSYPVVALARRCEVDAIRRLADMNLMNLVPGNSAAIHRACLAITSFPMAQVCEAVGLLLTPWDAFYSGRRTSEDAVDGNCPFSPKLFDDLWCIEMKLHFSGRPATDGLADLLDLLLSHVRPSDTMQPQWQIPSFMMVNQLECCKVLAAHGATVELPVLKYMFREALERRDYEAISFLCSLDGAREALLCTDDTTLEATLFLRTLQLDGYEETVERLEAAAALDGREVVAPALLPSSSQDHDSHLIREETGSRKRRRSNT
ncbi:hypothetical protein G7054_g11518 [Neopestalotiopsis clavispora]|nr:hypothetical protein G7054_g11518 [Neopestalotiopsis clavispora]